MKLVHESELKQVFKLLEEEKEIAIDTEFIRDNTYMPILCLIQIATKNETYIIDPIAYDISDIKPLLTKSSTLKILHSAKQDLDVVYKNLGIIISPIFDTQIAASILGMGDNISYKKLVRENFHADIDKGPKLTDWSKRPLNQNQLRYAAEDVLYLFKLRDKIRYLLILKERLAWVEEETARLYDASLYSENTDIIWTKISNSSPIPYCLNYLKEFAAVREKIANEQNRPRRYVLTDDILIQLSKLKPRKKEDILDHRILVQKINRKYIDLFIEAALKIDEKNDIELTGVKKVRLSSKEEIILELLKMLLKYQAIRHKVAIRMIATTEDLREFIKDPDNSSLFFGWRKEVFGTIAKKLIKGQLYIRVNVDMTLELIDRSS